MKTLQLALSYTLFALTTLLGVAAFLYPFWAPALAASSAAGANRAHAGDAMWVLAAIVIVCFAVLLLEVQTQAVSARTIALVGMLVAINSVLRFAEVAIPMPGGFTPVFVLVILGGYVFGARIGFLLGAMTLLVSSLVTGGVGPWLPYQMLTAGWVGMSAPLVRPVGRAAARIAGAAGEVAVLALFGALWGFLYGAIMNIWFWPYAMGPAQMYWSAGIGLAETIRRYALFYAVTSLVWDLAAALGNVLLIGLMGAAILRILRRFQSRFEFTYAPLASSAHGTHRSRDTGSGERGTGIGEATGPMFVRHSAVSRGPR